MTPSELKYHVESSGHESHFFDLKTMRFFGDSMRNYGVRRTTILATFDSDGNYHPEGVERDAWELYRRRPVKHGLQTSSYFDPMTFRRVFAKR